MTIETLSRVTAVLSSILDLAKGVLPDEEFACTLVVRSRHSPEDVPAHFLIGDDDAPMVATTSTQIATSNGYVSGQATAGEGLIGVEPTPDLIIEHRDDDEPPKPPLDLSSIATVLQDCAERIRADEAQDRKADVNSPFYESKLRSADRAATLAERCEQALAQLQ